MSILETYPTAVLVVACAMGGTGHAQEAQSLRSASVQITMTSPTVCEVAMSIEASASGDVDHRVNAPPGTEVGLLAAGAQVGGARQVGTTRSMVIRVDAGQPYRIRYRVVQPDERAFRCPLWVPALPANRLSRDVVITVRLPEAASPEGGWFPAFSWKDGEGTATLGHLPAFVVAPYAGQGTAPHARPRNLARAMDAVAVAVFALATAIWVWRRRRA